MIELLSGLLLLIAGAELMVRAAVRFAARLHVRPLIIGLTIVALGSSAPQMAVSLQATLAQNADIAVGSVIGSSIFNILVTLGLSALIIPLRVSRQLVRLDIPLMIGASLLVFVLAWNEELTRTDGVMLLTAMSAFCARVACRLTAICGALLPRATMVRPIISGRTCRRAARRTAARTINSAPAISNSKPLSNSITLIRGISASPKMVGAPSISRRGLAREPSRCHCATCPTVRPLRVKHRSGAHVSMARGR